MIVCVCGCRHFADYDWFATKLSEVLADVPVTMIVWGGARGVDTMANQWAKANGIRRRVIRADWDRYGKAAGPIRNGVMVRASDMVVAFWDGKSSGTGDMIRQSKSAGLRVVVVKLPTGE